MKISQLSTTDRNNIVNPTGVIIFNTTTNQFEKHNGTTWDIISGSSSASSIGVSNIIVTGSGTSILPNSTDLILAVFVDVQTITAITYKIVLPNQANNISVNLQFKFVPLSSNVTIQILMSNNTVITTFTGNPSIGINSYPSLTYYGNTNNYNANLFTTQSAFGYNLLNSTTATNAKSLLGISDAVLESNLFDTNGNIKQKLLPSFIVEDFIQSTTGNAITFAASTSLGGNIASEIPETQPNWNSGISRPRFGQSSVRITNVTNSRAAVFSNFNFRLFQLCEFTFGSDISIVGGQVNFVNDPVLLAAGFFDSFAVNNPVNGFYFRPPRVGETNFLKYVIRVGGLEQTVLNTSIPYDATNRRFVRTQITWNGAEIIFESTDGTNTSQNVFSNVLTTYPVFATTLFGYGIFNTRNGIGLSMVARNINVDNVYRFINTNYNNF